MPILVEWDEAAQEAVTLWDCFLERGSRVCQRVIIDGIEGKQARLMDEVSLGVESLRSRFTAHELQAVSFWLPVSGARRPGALIEVDIARQYLAVWREGDE